MPTNGKKTFWADVKNWSAILGVCAIIVGATLGFNNFVSKPDQETRERLIRIEDTLDTIKTNHLVHLQGSIDENLELIKDNQESIQNLQQQIYELLLTLQ